jgi:hypothetical protein
MTDALSCWNCGAALDQVLLPVSRHECCPQCAEAVHCCRMCVHFSRDAVDQCREDRAEPPTDKTSANFCDYFTPRLGAAAAAPSRQDEARAKLDALFGGGDGRDADERTRDG